jgi:hypothetical protein
MKKNIMINIGSTEQHQGWYPQDRQSDKAELEHTIFSTNFFFRKSTSLTPSRQFLIRFYMSFEICLNSVHILINLQGNFVDAIQPSNTLIGVHDQNI